MTVTPATTYGISISIPDSNKLIMLTYHGIPALYRTVTDAETVAIDVLTSAPRFAGATATITEFPSGDTVKTVTVSRSI